MHQHTYFCDRLTRPLLGILNWLTPLAALIARCWVGYVFLNSGWLKFMSWDNTIMLFTHEFQVPILSPYVAATLATVAEIALPILVILGLGSRLIIALLFMFNAVAVMSYPFLWTVDGLPGLLQHINWGMILLLLMCYGSGKLSIDYMIMKMRSV